MEIFPKPIIENLEQMEKPGAVIDKCVQKIEEQIQYIDEKVQKENRPEKKTNLEAIKEACREKAKAFLVFGTYVAAALSGYEAIKNNWSNSSSDEVENVKNLNFEKDQIFETVNELGEKIYSHSDELTTHNINVLAGVDTITYEEALNIYRQDLSYDFKDKIGGLSLDNYSIDQLDSVAAANLDSVQKKYHSKGDYKNYFLGKYNSLKKEQKLIREGGGRELYNLVWEMQKECGSPKVRFISNPGAIDPESPYRAYFIGQNNTCFISSPLLRSTGLGHGLYAAFDALFAESSHSKQLYDNPKSFNERNSKSQNKSRQEYDNTEYETPGTVEHEAHKIIEPELEKKYEKIFKPIGPSQEI